MKLVPKFGGGSASATLSKNPGSSHGARWKLASEYELARTAEIRAKVEMHQIGSPPRCER